MSNEKRVGVRVASANMMPCKLEQLPSSLTSHVCSFLSSGDILRSVRLACSTLNAVSQLLTSSPDLVHVPFIETKVDDNFELNLHSMLGRAFTFLHTRRVHISAIIGMNGLLQLDKGMPRLIYVKFDGIIQWTVLRLKLLSRLSRIQTLDCYTGGHIGYDTSSRERKESRLYDETEAPSEPSIRNLHIFAIDNHNVIHVPHCVTKLEVERLYIQYRVLSITKWYKCWSHLSGLTRMVIGWCLPGLQLTPESLVNMSHSHPHLEYLVLPTLSLARLDPDSPPSWRDDDESHFFPRLAHLQIDSCFDNVNVYQLTWINRFAATMTLTTLKLNNVMISAIGFKACIPPSVTSLGLESCYITNDHLPLLPTMLRSLDISANPQVHILSSLTSLTRLETLLIQYLALDTSVLPAIPSLTCLNATHVESLSESSVFSLELVPIYPNLKELHAPIHVGSYRPLADLPKLVSLHLPRIERDNDELDREHLAPLRLTNYSLYAVNEEDDEEEDD